jgi:C-terminal processing protease CtpA/Prc
MTLEVERADGRSDSIVVKWARRPAPEGFERPAPIAEVRPGIWYLDVERVNDSRFAAAVDTLAHARGLIFDVRGYPYHLGVSPLAHLADTTLVSGQWYVPLVRTADHRDPEYAFSHWPVPPEEPRFRGRVAFLIDGEAISYSETWLGIAEAFHLGAFVGEPTAGTNGNVNQFTLPGGYGVVFTGMKVLKQDGSLFHGVGIQPTVPVSPTLAGIRAGVDEQLEKAIETVSR